MGRGGAAKWDDGPDQQWRKKKGQVPSHHPNLPSNVLPAAFEEPVAVDAVGALEHQRLDSRMTASWLRR